MPSVSQLVMQITAKDEASGVFKNISDSAKKLDKSFTDITKTASLMTAGFVGAAGITAGIQTVVGFMSDSVKAASDLGESLNAVNVIFGESAAKILEWGKTNATSFGLSQRAFNQLATPLGALLKNMGLDMETVAGKTIDLTKRAADMASVFNTDVEDALQAIQAGLRGELDPLERYGVKLSAASVEQRALAETGKEAASQLTEQEKATARLALIFEQTNAVTGDFAATSDGLANKQRILNARHEELQATLGQKLLPVQLKITEAKLALVNALVTHVIPTLERLYREHWPAIQRAIEDVRPVIEFVANDFVARVEGIIQVIDSLVSAVRNMVELVSALFHGDWARAWEEAKQIAANFGDAIVGVFRSQLGALPELARDAMNGVIRWINSLVNRLSGREIVPAVSAPLIGEITPAVRLPGMPSIPTLDAGGVVSRPTLALLSANSRPEAVVPLDRAGPMREIVYVPVTGIPAFDRAVEDAVRSAASRGAFRGYLASA